MREAASSSGASTGHAYTIRENKDDDIFKIFDYEHSPLYTSESLIFQGSIHDVIQEANRLEEGAVGWGSFSYGHVPNLYSCPDDVAQEFPRIRNDLDS